MICWEAEDDSYPVGLILDNDGKRLRSAASYSNFTGYEQEDDDATATIIPAHPGWWLEWITDNQVTHYEPVIAWVIGRWGWGVKGILAPDSPDGGEPFEPDEHTRFVYDPGRPPWREPAAPVVGTESVTT